MPPLLLDLHTDDLPGTSLGGALEVSSDGVGASLLPGPAVLSRAPRPLAVGRLRDRLRDRPTLADERVALDVRPQGLGAIGTKLELEVNHLLKIDRGNTCSAGS